MTVWLQLTAVQSIFTRMSIAIRPRTFQSLRIRFARKPVASLPLALVLAYHHLKAMNSSRGGPIVCSHFHTLSGVKLTAALAAALLARVRFG
jgi:hypothetical protein